MPATAAAPSTSPHGDTATEVLRRHAARAVPPAYRAGTATPAEDASQAGAAALERPSSATGSRGWNTLLASTPQGTATTWQRAELPDDVSRLIDLLMLQLARPEPSSADAPVLLRITLQRDGLVLGELALGRTHMRWTPAADAMPSAFEAPLEARHAERLRAALLR